MKRSHRRRRWLGVLLATMVGSGGAAAEERYLEIEFEPPVVSPGEPATLRLRLVDAQGGTAPSDRTLAVLLEGGGGLLPNRVEVAAGQEVAEVSFRAQEPGAWKITASAAGARSAECWLVAAKPLPLRRGAGDGLDDDFRGFRPSAGPPPLVLSVPPTVSPEELTRIFDSIGDIHFEENAERWNLGSDALATRESVLSAARHPRVRAGGDIRLRGSGVEGSAEWYSIRGLPGIGTSVTARTGDDLLSASVHEVELGELRLLAQPESPRSPVRGKWGAVELLAVWFGTDGERLVPRARESPLSLDLELRDYAHEPGLDPGTRLTIPRGGSVATASLTSDRAQTVRLGARWLSGRSEPIEVRYLSPPAHGLVFLDLPAEVHGIGPLRRGIGVGLVDDTGAATVGDRDAAVTVRWFSSEDAGGTESVTIGAGQELGSIEIELGEPGRYSLSARPQQGQLVAAEAQVDYLFSSWLAGVALAGGLLGAVAVALFRRERTWWRTLALGVAAAVVAVLLALFGVLHLLEGVLPGASALEEKVPVQTTLGMLSIALVAGMAGEAIVGLFAGPTPQAPPAARRSPARRRRRSSPTVRKERRRAD